MVRTGEEVTVSLMVESQSRFSRPLLLIHDLLPQRMRHEWIRYPLPVAPAYLLPVQIQYKFRPLRRGSYRWSEVLVSGTDALGLASAEMKLSAGETTMKVLPSPIPFEIDLSLLQGTGFEHTAPKRLLSSSIDTRGIRDYAAGDPMRHIHWASTARTGRLMVKDFESQASSRATLLLQRTIGTDIGHGATSLDVMCGHAAHLVDRLHPICSHLGLNEPLQFDNPSDPGLSYLDVLSELKADRQGPLSEELSRVLNSDQEPGQIYLFLISQDDQLPTVLRSASAGSVRVLVYRASQFTEKPLIRPASSPEYVRLLERSGATVQFMEFSGE